MDYATLAATTLVSLVGIGVASAISYKTGRRDRRDTLLLTTLPEAVSQVATHSRRLLDLSTTAQTDAKHVTLVDLTLREVREACSMVALLGDDDVRRDCEVVRRHAYAVAQVARGAEDPRPTYVGTPYVRLDAALSGLMDSTRSQLGLTRIGTRRDLDQRSDELVRTFGIS